MRNNLRTLDPTLAAVAVPVLLLGVLGWGRRWMSDDGFIYLRVLDNLLHGVGPVFNHGERVEAYTSPLWLGLLAAVSGPLRFVPEEWVAVALGLLLTLGGLAAGIRGALLLWRGAGRQGLALPAGAFAIAAVPDFWDFSTSGLDTGISFAWLGLSFWALAALATERDRRWTAGRAALLIGLGPLVRPDLALFSLPFFVGLLLVCRPALRGALRLLAIAAALPLAYQLFRMGYFGALAAAPAYAKEAGIAYWSRGLKYVGDFVYDYLLFVPVGALAALAVVEGRRMRIPRAQAVVAAAVLAGGALHLLYVIRVGGDFMHGRLALPSFFALLLPVAVVVPSRRAAGVLLAAVAGWGVVSIAALRPGAYGPFQTVDERGFYVREVHHANPVTLDDYERYGLVSEGRALRALAGRTRVILVNQEAKSYVARGAPVPRRSLPTRVFGRYFQVGMLSYAAGQNVHIADPAGLGDAVAARQRLEPGRPGRVGHEKQLNIAWMVARYADAASVGTLSPPERTAVDAARRALGCGDLAKLVEVVDEPLTLGRFGRNLGRALTLNDFRMPSDPVAAERELCG